MCAMVMHVLCVCVRHGALYSRGESR
jgi:hypothetical protein